VVKLYTIYSGPAPPTLDRPATRNNTTRYDDLNHHPRCFFVFFQASSLRHMIFFDMLVCLFARLRCGRNESNHHPSSMTCKKVENHFFKVMILIVSKYNGLVGICISNDGTWSEQFRFHRTRTIIYLYSYIVKYTRDGVNHHHHDKSPKRWKRGGSRR
jgi:hypothetical protein